MKKILIILGGLLVILFLALLITPYFFKDRLVQLIKDQANENLNAELAFEEINLSFFSHFPKLTLEIEELKLTGVDNFDGIELINIKSFGLSLGLGKLIKGDLPEIIDLYIIDPNINAVVHPSGVANWDIVKESAQQSESKVEKDESSTESFEIQLSHYLISNANIRYEDEGTGILLVVEGLTHEGSGNFSNSNFELLTNTSIVNLLFEMKGEKFIDDWTFNARIDLAVNLDEGSYTLIDNEIKINELILHTDGNVLLADSSISINLKIDAPSVDLKQLFSLIPPSYASDLNDFSFGGTSSLKTWIKGDYTDDSYPLFALDLSVNNGTFQHKDLPKAVKNIEIVAHAELPDANDLDAFWIDISKLNIDLGGNPIAAGFTLHHPMSSMDFDARISASINLDNLKDVLPDEDAATYTGIIRANLQAAGSLEQMQKENYEDLTASGKLHVEAIEYNSDKFSQAVIIKKASMEFKMDEVDLESFEANIGESNIMADGSLKGFIPYVLYDKKLSGELNLKSNYLNVDELMVLMLEDTLQVVTNEEISEAEAQNTSSPDSISQLLPKNIDFKLRTGVSKLLYDNIEMKDFQGDITLRDAVLSLESCKAEMLGGNIKMSGKFDESIPKEPIANFNFDITDFNIKESAEKIKLIQKYAPIAKYASGSFSANVLLRSQLDNEWNPIAESVYSKGKIRTKSVKIEGFKALSEFSKITKTESILNNEFEDLDISYEIIDGKGYIKPFDFRIDKLKGNSSGSIDIEQNLDFDVHMTVPTEMLGDGANQLMGQIAGALSGLGIQTEIPENIDMDIKITGKVDNPIIKPNFTGISGEKAKEVVKQKIEEEIGKAKEEAIDRAAEEAAKILADARKEANKLLKDAQKNVDLLKKEGYAQADKLVEDASNYFEKIAANVAAKEMKKQIDKQAENLMNEARKQADKILEDAQKQADRIKN